MDTATQATNDGRSATKTNSCIDANAEPSDSCGHGSRILERLDHVGSEHTLDLDSRNPQSSLTLSSNSTLFLQSIPPVANMIHHTLSFFVLSLASFGSDSTVSAWSSRWNTGIGFRRPGQQGTRLASSGVQFQFSETSLQHLENTELPDDYSRPWTPEKVKAFATAMVLGGILGFGGEVAGERLLDIEKTFVLWGGLGAAGGWYLGGGAQIAQDEKPINGGYDRKLIADRPSRMKSVLETLREEDVSWIATSTSQDVSAARKWAAKVHSPEYLEMLEQKCQQADRPQRLNPLYSRTLIDQHSFTAALSAATDWMASVDAALSQNSQPIFALVRPPSHHACQGKGMGGCLLNSVAIAALYAIEHHNVRSVAILDIDAHHGNGIAHCIQDLPQARYCSIHEDASSGFLGRTKDDPLDPRSADSDDRGPLGNILNINLPSGTTWESGYKNALKDTALPFLLGKDDNNDPPDLLLVAAGFDALDADVTSRLALQPEDFEKISTILSDTFGNRIACGLEGGYCWQGGQLNQAISKFVQPFR